MYKHTVIFRLNGTAEQRRELAERFSEAILALRDQIDVIRDVVTGVNINPDESADVMLTVTVDNFEDIATYSAHPAHIAAAGILKGHVETRLCVDAQA